MNRIFDDTKIDNVVQIASRSGTINANFVPMGDYRKAAYLVTCTGMVAGDTLAIQIQQAQDAAATGLKNVTGATATITGNVNASRVSIALASVTAGETVVINGITYTAHATTTTVANREFSIAGTDAQDAAELATCLTDSTYGISGASITVSTATVNVQASEYGENYFTVVGDTNITVTSTFCTGYVEIEADQMDTYNGFEYISALLTMSTTLLIDCQLIRGGARYTPTQYFNAYKLGV